MVKKRNWDEFVNKYSRLVYFSIKECARRRAFSLSEEDAEDIHQKVFFSIWKDDKLSQLKDQSKLPAWISMISVNATLDHIRSKDYLVSRKNISLFEKAPSHEEASTLEDVLQSSRPGPRREAEANEVAVVIDEALSAIEPKARLAVKLNFIQGKSHSEISRMLDIPLGSVATLISRAKGELKKRLKEKGIEDF